MKKNSFRCFSIFKSGIGENNGEFLLVHQRGCKKTFSFTEKLFRQKLTEYNYESNNRFQQSSQFKFDNWYAIRDEQNKEKGIWFALLCFPNCNQEKVFKALYKLQAMYLKRKDYFLLSQNELNQVYEVEKIVQDTEINFYGQPEDGYITEEDQSSSTKKQKQSIAQSEQRIADISQFTTPSKEKQKIIGSANQQADQYCKTINQLLQNSKSRQISYLIDSQPSQPDHVVQPFQSQTTPPIISPNVQPLPVVKREKCQFDFQEAQRELQKSKQKKVEIKKSWFDFFVL